MGVAFPALVFFVLLSHELHMYIAQWLKGKSPKTLNQRILPKMHLQKYYIHFRWNISHNKSNEIKIIKQNLYISDAFNQAIG